MSRKIALIGNQNCGKTTLFNALTGSSQHVGNFPGVTVEQKKGFIKTLRKQLPGRLRPLWPHPWQAAGAVRRIRRL